MNPIYKVVEACAAVLRMLQTPNERGIFIYSIMSNLVGNMDPVAWKQITDQAYKPCGELNCTCHIVRKKFFDALEAIRKDFKEEMGQRRSTRRNHGFGQS